MNIICSKCGGTHIMCEAMIEPNTKKFEHYTDESFLYGWCDDCQTGTILTDVDEVKNDMKAQYRVFKESYGIEPQYANCRIAWKDDRKQDDVKIMLSAELAGDDIFYNCNSLNGLLSLAECGKEDFIITQCYGFATRTEKERLEQQTFEYEVEDKTISMTGKEIMDFYGEHYGLNGEEMQRYAARNACLIKYYKESDAPLLDSLLVKKLLGKEGVMETGETENFKLQLFFLWHVTIKKEDDTCYKPFRYVMDARCLDNMQSFGRRYTSLEAALLHCLNGFNENANIPDRYRSTNEYISKQRQKGGELWYK